MISLGPVSPHTLSGYQQSMPIKQPSYKDEEIAQLKNKESDYEDELTKLGYGNDPDTTKERNSVQSDLSEVEARLEELKPDTAVKPKAAPPPPPQQTAPPTDAEMNRRFGSAYAVEIGGAANADSYQEDDEATGAAAL